MVRLHRVKVENRERNTVDKLHQNSDYAKDSHNVTVAITHQNILSLKPLCKICISCPPPFFFFAATSLTISSSSSFEVL